MAVCEDPTPVLAPGRMTPHGTDVCLLKAPTKSSPCTATLISGVCRFIQASLWQSVPVFNRRLPLNPVSFLPVPLLVGSINNANSWVQVQVLIPQIVDFQWD